MLISATAAIWRRGLFAGCFIVGVCAMFPAGCSSTGNAAPKQEGSAATISLAANPRVDEVLGNSCFDCHSDQGSGSWNAKFAPSYLFGAHAARKVLNFSDWPALDAQQRSAMSSAVATAVSNGSMPPGDYAFFHPSAKLSDEQKNLVSQWALAQTALPAH